MALRCIMGLMGAGKSYVAVNRFLLQELQDSNRPIYTNLPIDGLELERLLVRASKRLETRDAMRRRIHFLPSAAGEEVCRVELVKEGEAWKVIRLDGEKEGKEKGQAVTRDLLLEFWYFTEPNAVVLLDEVGDIYNTDQRSDRPDFLVSYINHHRHYKDDLWFFLQDLADLDPQVRRKLQYVYVITNSLKTNLTEWWALRGLRWPVQFFRVRMVIGSKVRNRDPYQVSERDPDEAFSVWPTKAGFRCYRSFSQASTIPGKKSASEAALSSDIDPRLLPKIMHWLSQSGGAVAMFGGVGVALWLGVHFVYRLAGVNSGQLASGLSGSPAPAAASVPSAKLSDGGAGRTNGVGSGSAALPAERERVVLVSPSFVRTTKGRYEVGSKVVGGRVVSRVFLDGFEFEGGERARFDSVF